MIKLVAIDMDGTLLDSDHRLSKENIKAIQELVKKGVHVVLCTGRPKSGVLPYFEELGLSGQHYAILNNGCALYETENWDLIAYHEVPQNEVEHLFNQVNDFEDVYLTLTTTESYITLGDKVPKLIEEDAKLVFDTSFAISVEDYHKKPEPIFKAMYVAPKDKMDVFESHVYSILKDQFSTVRSQDYLFEVLPKGITKATGLSELIQSLGYDKSEVMALGDALNDLEMLEFVGLGVAMGNARDEIKEVADVITDTNDNSGVAKAIYQYILGKKNS